MLKILDLSHFSEVFIIDSSKWNSNLTGYLLIHVYATVEWLMFCVFLIRLIIEIRMGYCFDILVFIFF